MPLTKSQAKRSSFSGGPPLSPSSDSAGYGGNEEFARDDEGDYDAELELHDEGDADSDEKSELKSIIPICRCGAAPCRYGLTESGRAYLTCCIKKGFGSCGFFKWIDVEMVQLEDQIEQYQSAKRKLQETAKNLKKQVERFKKHEATKGETSEAAQAEGSLVG